MKISLRNKFLIPMIALIILGVGVSGTLSYLRAKAALETTISGEISQIVSSTQNIMTSWLRDRTLDIRSWSKQTIFTTALEDSSAGQSARKSSNAILSQLKNDYEYYENIVIANPQGDIMAAAEPSVVGKVKVKDRAYFEAAISGKLYTSGVIKSRGSGHPVFAISTPLMTNDQIVGVLFGILDINIFNKLFIDPIKVGKTGYAFVYDRQGNMIAHPDKSLILKLNMKDLDFGREMMKKTEGVLHYKWKGVEKLVGFTPNKTLGWTICANVDKSDILAPVKALRNMNIWVTGISLIVSVIVVLFIVRSIVTPINNIVRLLNESAEQVTSASGEISSSSQSLAEGASEQAASIEETSSSLEEMSSMTKQNADNANQADNLMKAANQVVSQAESAMTKLNDSMVEIAKASEETSKIIKTIDEIAFQTNLLALNAAVEAARAGEAGAGFAVVADEVRNLAMRAAEAAKNTAALIESTVTKVGGGSELVGTTNDAFAQVADSARQVGELVAEIAVASNEQAKGIEQVNKAVTEMDTVTQQNAANAEESASAAGQMSAQAAQMKVAVGQLIALISGSGNKYVEHAHTTTASRTPARQPTVRPAAQPKKELRPEQIIPMDDGDFTDF